MLLSSSSITVTSAAPRASAEFLDHLAHSERDGPASDLKDLVRPSGPVPAVPFIEADRSIVSECEIQVRLRLAVIAYSCLGVRQKPFPDALASFRSRDEKHVKIRL